MDVVIFLVFVSLVLVAAGLVFFLFRLKEGDFDHGERLALSPLRDDSGENHETTEAPLASQSAEQRKCGDPEGGTLHVDS